jgi:hypothetical protein
LIIVARPNGWPGGRRISFIGRICMTLFKLLHFNLILPLLCVLHQQPFVHLSLPVRNTCGKQIMFQVSKESPACIKQFIQMLKNPNLSIHKY